MKKLFIAFAGSMIFLMSCKQAEDISQIYGNEFNLKCAKTAWTQDTRVITSDTGNGDFSDNDCIEVQVMAGDMISGKQLQYVSGRWTPSLNRSDYARGEWSLSALFPVLPQSAGNKENRDLHLPLDQSTSKKCRKLMFFLPRSRWERKNLLLLCSLIMLCIGLISIWKVQCQMI